MKIKHDQTILELIRDGVLSVDDEGKVWRHKGFRMRRSAWEPLEKPTCPCLISASGYLSARIWNGKAISIMAHRIVWVWHHRAIDSSKEINHLNGIRTDNRIDNLELVTCSENNLHAHKFLPREKALGESHGQAKLKTHQVINILSRLHNGESTRCIGSELGVHHTAIHQIAIGQTWNHISGLPRRER